MRRAAHPRSRARLLAALPPMVLCLMSAACSGGDGEPEVEAWSAVDPAAAEGATADALERAAAARAALFQRLSGRLAEVVSAEGHVEAIRVCRDEAPGFAADVGDEHGVRIGRTGVRLRNPDNVAPAWAQPAVEARVAERRAWVRPDGAVAELAPILLAEQCVACHGTPDKLAPGVPEALAELYPEDRATGFAQGELRGWFWVEVPAGD